MLKKPTIIETRRLNRLRWFGHVQRMEENRIPRRVLYVNLGTTNLRGRPRNRWQGEVREDGKIVGGEGWQEKLRNRKRKRWRDQFYFEDTRNRNQTSSFLNIMMMMNLVSQNTCMVPCVISLPVLCMDIVRLLL